MNLIFYKNSGTFCAQTCMKIILKHFFPKKNFSLQKLAKLSYKKKGGLTNSAGIVLALDSLGLKAKLYTKNINLSEKNLLKKIKIKKLAIVKKLKISDLKKSLEKKYLMIVLLNWGKIKNKKKYIGHYIILNKINSKKISVINVGPAKANPNYIISLNKFNKAWHSKGTDSDVIVIYNKK